MGKIFDKQSTVAVQILFVHGGRPKLLYNMALRHCGNVQTRRQKQPFPLFFLHLFSDYPARFSPPTSLSHPLSLARSLSDLCSPSLINERYPTQASRAYNPISFVYPLCSAFSFWEYLRYRTVSFVTCCGTGPIITLRPFVLTLITTRDPRTATTAPLLSRWLVQTNGQPRESSL